MGSEILKGQISDIEKGAVTEGRVFERGGTIDTSETVTFRVGKRAVSFKLGKAFKNRQLSLKEGDHVTIVGKPSAGEFTARAMRNDDTGVVYAPSPSHFWGWFIGLFVVGLLLSVVFIGLALIPVSFLMILEALNAQRINNKLRNA
ncbi:hypothetical protein [Parvularcula lutaonensis]|uniref:DUF3592 domain-containing protein n=1 Tax=Parvularcula lutaonensis TaxID=491923 RepID=A0ABV7MAF9_9PROT|nr:hypothetical protein [Parvularcula lutaonensis]GGY37097.1 hypothetical protein GCM10007148_01610 [Parvularcula lutaonensis]